MEKFDWVGPEALCGEDTHAACLGEFSPSFLWDSVFLWCFMVFYTNTNSSCGAPDMSHFPLAWIVHPLSRLPEKLTLLVTESAHIPHHLLQEAFLPLWWNHSFPPCSWYAHAAKLLQLVWLCVTPWWQPTRLPHPWDSPGKNTGVGCHFLLQCMNVKSETEIAQSCLTLCYPMDCSLPGSSVHGVFQARVLAWGAIAFSKMHM